MEPYQDRVVQEKADLDRKIEKLSKFINDGDIFPTMNAEDQDRLREQCDIMWQYSEILGERIAEFE